MPRAFEAVSIERAEGSRHRAPAPELHSDRSDRPFTDVVDALWAANDEALHGLGRLRGGYILPSRDAVASLIDDLRAVLFPGHFGAPDLGVIDLRAYIANRLGRAQLVLTEQVRRGLSFACEHGEGDNGRICASCDRGAHRVRDAFIAQLPAIRTTLMTVRQAGAGWPTMPPQPGPALYDWELETIERWTSNPVKGPPPAGNRPPTIAVNQLPSVADQQLSFTAIVDDPDSDSVVGVVEVEGLAFLMNRSGSFDVSFDSSAWPTGAVDPIAILCDGWSRSTVDLGPINIQH